MILRKIWYIINKLRNSIAHFRFKVVKDHNNNIIDDKIYLYDEYNDGTFEREICQYSKIIDKKRVSVKEGEKITLSSFGQKGSFIVVVKFFDRKISEKVVVI